MDKLKLVMSASLDEAGPQTNVQTIISQITSFLESLGGRVIASINVQALETIAEGAFVSGGPAAVIPALVNGVSQWCSSPVECWAIVFALKFAETLLPV